MEDLIEIKPTLIEKSNKMSCFIIFSLETNNCDEEIMFIIKSVVFCLIFIIFQVCLRMLKIW
jgi:hypothetical protein